MAVALPPKKPKRLYNYRADWSAEFNWCLKVAVNVFAAECNLCRKTFSIGHGGRSDLLQHSKTLSNVQLKKMFIPAHFFCPVFLCIIVGNPNDAQIVGTCDLSDSQSLCRRLADVSSWMS